MKVRSEWRENRGWEAKRRHRWGAGKRCRMNLDNGTGVVMGGQICEIIRTGPGGWL